MTLILLVVIGGGLVIAVWGGAAWRSYTKAEDFDLTRPNTAGWFPYGIPLVLPLWVLRRRRRRQEGR